MLSSSLDLSYALQIFFGKQSVLRQYYHPFKILCVPSQPSRQAQQLSFCLTTSPSLSVGTSREEMEESEVMVCRVKSLLLRVMIIAVVKRNFVWYSDIVCFRIQYAPGHCGGYSGTCWSYGMIGIWLIKHRSERKSG